MQFPAEVMGSRGGRVPTRDDPGAGERRPGLVAWVLRREIALSHRSHWRCHGPWSVLCAVLLYPLWVAVEMPLAAVLGLVKVAVIAAMLAALGAGVWSASRALSPQPLPLRGRSSPPRRH